MIFSVAELLEPGTLIIPKLPPRSECKSLCRLPRPDIDNADGPGRPIEHPWAGGPGMDADVLRSESNFGQSTLAFLSSVSFARLTSISALRL